MLNEDVSIAVATTEDGRCYTMYDAVQACIEGGMSPDKISAKSDYKIAWESTTGKFVLLDMSVGKVIYPQNENSYSEYIVENPVNYFIVSTYDNRVEEDSNFKYSIFAYGNDWPKEITVHAGFDVGDVKFDKVTYESTVPQDVIIRTNINTKLVVDSINNNIIHYDEAYLVDIQNGNYSEQGFVGRLKLAQTANLTLVNYSEVCCLMNENLNNNNISIGEHAVIHENKLLEEKDDLGIAHTNVAICSTHNKDLNNTEIISGENNYLFCTICGASFVNRGKVVNLESGEVNGATPRDAKAYSCVYDWNKKKCLTHGTKFSSYNSNSEPTYYCYCEQEKVLGLIGDKNGTLGAIGSASVFGQPETYLSEAIVTDLTKINTLVITERVQKIEGNKEIWSNEGIYSIFDYDKITISAKVLVYENDIDFFKDYYYNPIVGSEMGDMYPSFYIKTLEEVIIPDDSTLLRAGYFPYDSKEIVIQKNFTKMEKYCFVNYSNLEKVTFEEGSQIKEIPVSTFFLCTKLNSITLPEGLENVCKDAFNDTALTSIKIPGGVKTVSKYSFSGISKLKTIIIGEGVEKIETDAFYGCGDYSYPKAIVDAIYLPVSLKYIEDYIWNTTITSVVDFHYAGTYEQWDQVNEGNYKSYFPNHFESSYSE